MSEQDTRVHIPRMTEAERKDFIRRFVQNQIFTSLHVPEKEIELLRIIFMPIGLGALAQLSEEVFLDEFALFWEDMDKAAPRAINGYPCFFSMHMMNKKDWEICAPVIEALQKRLENFEAKDEEEDKFKRESEEVLFSDGGIDD